MEQKRILILGGTGMLGHVLFRYLSGTRGYDVYASVRDKHEASNYFAPRLLNNTRSAVEADRFETILDVIEEIQPAVIINCIGVIKQLPIADDQLAAITINAQLPHRIAHASRRVCARMIHISTDCVFDGKKGMYREDDDTTARDLYGRTKILGEVAYTHCVTMRTSIIGHELRGGYGLIEWFLAQTGTVQGYKQAIYSGFPTIELARIICDYVLPNPALRGIYHVSSEPTSKFDLLTLVAKKYRKTIEIEPNEDFVQNRSLNSDLFRNLTGYTPPAWPELVDAMCRDYADNRKQYYNLVRNSVP